MTAFNRLGANLRAVTISARDLGEYVRCRRNLRRGSRTLAGRMLNLLRHPATRVTAAVAPAAVLAARTDSSTRSAATVYAALGAGISMNVLRFAPGVAGLCLGAAVASAAYASRDATRGMGTRAGKLLLHSMSARRPTLRAQNGSGSVLEQAAKGMQQSVSALVLRPCEASASAAASYVLRRGADSALVNQAAAMAPKQAPSFALLTTVGKRRRPGKPLRLELVQRRGGARGGAASARV